MSGFIKLHRKITEWEWYDDANTFKLFIHCLLKANYKSKNWHGIEIKKGQFITSLNNLSKELKMSIQSIRTSIKRLKSTHELTYESTSKNSLITVVNYSIYQSENSELTHELTHELTNKQQASNKQVTTTKKEKKEKKDKNIKKEANTYVISDNENHQCMHKEIIELYHNILPMLPKVLKWNAKRRTILKARWLEDKNYQDLNFWKSFFVKISKSDFLTGKTDKPFLPNLEWILKASNFIKILEGNYDNRKKFNKQQNQDDMLKKIYKDLEEEERNEKH